MKKLIVVGIILVGIFGAAGITYAATSSTALTAGNSLTVTCPNAISNSAIGAGTETVNCATYPGGAKAIPVLLYHQLNNGCAATAATCTAAASESVSSKELTNQLTWMKNQGYQSINLTQYDAWLGGNATGLPTKPFLITVDNGIQNFDAGAAPILQSFGDTAVNFLDSGYADGAAGICGGTPDVANPTVDTQGGQCPSANEYWNSTWANLQAIQAAYPGLYQWSLEGGPSGHYVQNYVSTSADTGVTDPNCYQFYACEAPGETDAQYEARVQADWQSGINEITANLGAANSDFNGWVVPYSDLGYPQQNTAQDSTGPAGWLVNQAAATYQSVFVEDSSRNGIAHERYRWDLGGNITQAQFTAGIKADMTAGYFNN
jgi:hypothetical protein